MTALLTILISTMEINVVDGAVVSGADIFWINFNVNLMFSVLVEIDIVSGAV